MPFQNDSEFICIIGFDLNLYKEALDWVDEHRRVVFISTEDEVSSDSKVKIYHLESPLQIGLFARKIAWSAVFQKMEILGDGPIKEEIEQCSMAAHLILSEAADCWVQAVKNRESNRCQARDGLRLKGAFEKIPAIIVGAGPSLEKNGHLLEKFKDKALIFAGGSALNVIGVAPHFAASIDATAPFMEHPFQTVPFCYQSRINPENLSHMLGEKLLFPDGSCEWINWMNNQEPFEGGWTVGNFLTALASFMGCAPIIFVGMDYAYKDGRKYARIEAENRSIQVGDEWTQKDWLMAAQWTEEMGQGKQWINATEGGILNLEKKPLLEILKMLERRGDLDALISSAIQALPFIREREKSDKIEEKLLEPLWQIWKPIFDREVEKDPTQDIEFHKQLFFQRVLQEHGS